MENVQTFLRSKNANFVRKFDISTTAPVNNFDICLRAIHYMTKAFTLTVIIQVLRKKPSFFQKPKFFTFREIVIFQSLSTNGKLSNSKPKTSVKLDIINWKNVKKRSNSDLTGRFTFYSYIWAGKTLKPASPRTAMGNT